MKPTLLASMAIVAAVAMAATKELPRAVRDVVERALAGEYEAVARYEAFAKKAEEEGYRGAAALFRAQAKSERIHAGRFAAILRDHDLPVPAEEPPKTEVGSTQDNLRAAARSERVERDTTYHDAVEICQEYRMPELAAIFDQSRDSETEHANLCDAAARNLGSMKEPRSYYVCDQCGFTTEIQLPFCPLCRNKRELTRVE
ncbi:MAG TPA: rubrerythrin family protein [Thermoanaerobaculia bacterium]|nr:rubrerythrin family protein [Thermoanaerobaculia bacterium]